MPGVTSTQRCGYIISNEWFASLPSKGDDPDSATHLMLSMPKA